MGGFAMDTNYIGKVVWGAWVETRESFGLNKQTVATGLVGIIGFVVLAIRSGLAGAFPTMSESLLAALPLLLAATILFVVNIIQTQAKLYAELAREHAELKGTQEKRKNQKPNYEAVRHMDTFTLGQASRLWCDIDQNTVGTSHSQAWLQAFEAAIRRGKLTFIPRQFGSDSERYERENADHSTQVTREALLKFAIENPPIPKFLSNA
jgi:hypothetical protein